MTTERSRLTDHDIERFLRARSAEPDLALWSDIVAAAGAAPQRSGLWARWTSRRRVAAIVLSAVLLVAMAGAIGVGLSIIRPVPPAPSPDVDEALDFDRQFSYALPTDFGLELDVASTGMYRFTGTDRGIVVVAIRPGTVTHECRPGRSGRTVIGGTPTEVLENLRVIGGVGIGVQSASTFDGRPSLSADIDPLRNTCEPADIRIPAPLARTGTLALDVPARLILSDVDGLVVGVQIWSENAADLQEWIATANEFVDTIHFFGRAVKFDAPFEYGSPAAFGMSLQRATGVEYSFEAADRGVEVFAVRSNAQTHGCSLSDEGWTDIGATADEALENLRAISTTVGPIATTTLASHPALMADIEPLTDDCGLDIHLFPRLHGPVVVLYRPSRLILADVNGVVVGVLIWAEEPDEFEAWLPAAMEFVETIEFRDP